MATATDVSELLASHPRPSEVNREVLARCIAECYDCARSCTICVDADLAEENVAEMRRCIRLCLDCADVCIATGRTVSRQTEYEPETARTEVESCGNPARPAPRSASATPNIMSIAGSALRAAAVARQPAPLCSTRSELFWSHAEAMGASGCGRSAPAPPWVGRTCFHR